MRLSVVQLLDLQGEKLARSRGFEPLTAWFVARYSIQLSYERVKGVNTNNFQEKCNLKSVFVGFPRKLRLTDGGGTTVSVSEKYLR